MPYVKLRAKSDHETIIIDDRGEVFCIAASKEAMQIIINSVNLNFLSRIHELHSDSNIHSKF
ncbi:MAG TPA: hypothetical protein VJN02_12735 [Gammaproteobacteria bacterium]|nr:hypothetical protein [Gammaproteobacteria bacterium]